MNVYTHTVIGDLAEAVEALPPIPAAKADPAALADTGTDGPTAPGDADTDGPAEDGARRRTRRRGFSGRPCENEAKAGESQHDRPDTGAEGASERKPLRLADKDKGLPFVASPVAHEADGSRTRNHRIDSPVL